MSPADLDQLLAVLRKHCIMSADVPLASGTLRVVFGPEAMPPLPDGDPVTPGGWKGPDRLDAPLALDEAP